MKKILIIDDMQDTTEALQFSLQKEGYIIDTANCVEEALGKRLDNYSLVFLNVMRGDASALELAKIIRNMSATFHVPTLFVVAPESRERIVKGLGIGNDDCITRPMDMSELRTKMKNIMRRMEIKKAGLINEDDLISSIDFEGLHINTETKQLLVDGRHVQATYLELELLSFLIKNKGKVFSRNELISKIWPEDTIVLERTVDVNITRIRKKIAPYGEHIKTRFGYGYYFS